MNQDTRESLDACVLIWLDGIAGHISSIDDNTRCDARDFDVGQSTRKRKSRLPPTPPISTMQGHGWEPETEPGQEGEVQHAQTPKRQKLVHEQPDKDNEKTPRPLLPPRPESSVSQSQSQSSTGSGASKDQSQSSRQSPTKAFASLELISGGIETRSMAADDARMPSALSDLLADMERIATGLQVVPNYCKASVSPLPSSLFSPCCRVLFYYLNKTLADLQRSPGRCRPSPEDQPISRLVLPTCFRPSPQYRNTCRAKSRRGRNWSTRCPQNSRGGETLSG